MSRELARAAATFEWGWSADELERLVDAVGWTWREPSEGAVTCEFGTARSAGGDAGGEAGGGAGRKAGGDAGAGAFVFRGEVTAIYQNLIEHDTADVLDRRDAFCRAVDDIAEVLGPPPTRTPGPDPSAGWPVAAGVLEVVDRPQALDLWLRPEQRRPTTPPQKAKSHTNPIDWYGLTTLVATEAACLPAGTTLRVGPSITLTQRPDRLTVTVAGTSTAIDWPATGTTYRSMAAGLVAWLRDETGHSHPDEVLIS
ncbi:DUF6301 family protein [Actinoplanes sp. NPDC023936]|uniref:DUF6301 family protein n=1 Tax=Actinoplanes sp. NPDC023936 TaxID=3154910 RepID=UPI0033E9D943